MPIILGSSGGVLRWIGIDKVWEALYTLLNVHLHCKFDTGIMEYINPVSCGRGVAVPLTNGRRNQKLVYEIIHKLPLSSVQK